MDLDSQLAQLEKAQLVRRLTEEELAYLFKHALVQDTAYAALLKNERKRLHRVVGETLEHVQSGPLDESAALLAYHYALAGDDAKTLQYALLAGDAAARRFANAEAASFYDQALQALSHLPDEAGHRRQRVEAIISRVGVTLRAEGPQRSLTRLLEAEALARELYGAAPADRVDRLQLARIHYWIAQAYLHANSTAEAIRYLQDALVVAESESDEELRAVPESMLGRALFLQGQFDDAEPHLRQAVQLLRERSTNHEWFMAVGILGATLAARGNYPAGLAEGERALALGLETGNMTGAALSGMALCMIALSGGDMSRLAEASDAAILPAEKAGDRLVAHIGYAFRAWAESRLGDHAAADADLAKSKRIGQQLGARLVFAEWFAAASAEIAFNAGRIVESITLSKEAVEAAGSVGDIFAQGLAQRTWVLALASGSPGGDGESLAHLAESLRLFESGDARLEAARTHAAWGKLCGERGDFSEARGHFEQAARRFKAAGLEYEADQTLRLLNELQEAR